jgi:hypothetical protein
MPDDVQPNEGQGGGGEGIFDSYLESVPEDQRGPVESYLKDAERNVNSRIAESAEIQKTLGPYQQVEALQQYDPEQLNELLAWHQQVTSSDDAFKSWLESTAQEVGITPKDEAALQEAEEQGEITKEQVQELVEEKAQERLAPIEQRFNQIEAEKAVDWQDELIKGELSTLESQNKLKLDENQRAAILDLALPLAFDEKGNELPLDDTSWVKAGFDRFKEMWTEGQRAFVSGASEAPASPLTGGGTPRLEATTDWSEATKMARERFAQLKRT